MPPDSPLRNPPAATDPRQKVAFDALRCSLDSAHISWARLLHALHQTMMEADAGGTKDGNSIGLGMTVAMTDAWAMVDHLWRIHQVIPQIPNLKKSPELKAHLRAFSEVEQLRHSIQHIEERFKETSDSPRPLWGTLTWFWTPEGDGPVTNGKIFSTSSGAMRDNLQFDLVNPAGRRIERPIGLVTLCAFGQRLELSTYARRIRRICDGFDAGLRKVVGDAPGSGGDILISADFVAGASAAAVQGETGSGSPA